MATATVKPARRNARYANARRCFGRYDDGKRCTGDIFDGEMLCPKCRAAGGIRPAPYRN